MIASIIIFIIGFLVFFGRYILLPYREAEELNIFGYIAGRAVMWFVGWFLMGYALYEWGWRIVNVGPV